MAWYVEIYNKDSNEVAESMGPMTESSAERVMRGASINLNHRDWAVRMVEREEQK